MARTATQTDMAIYAGGVYAYGGSLSPDRIYVEAIHGDWVHFRTYPYTEARREQMCYFRLLATSGTRTELARCERLLAEYPDATWIAGYVDHFHAVLAGNVGRTWELDDMRRVGLVIRYTGDGDGWSEWERYYPHSVSSGTTDGRELTTYDFSANEAGRLRARLHAGEFHGFEFGAITEYR